MVVEPILRRHTRVCALALILGFGAAGSGGSESAVVAERMVARDLPGLRADVATLILQGASGGSIDMATAVAVDAKTSVEGNSTLSLVIEVSGQSLLEAAKHEAVRDRLLLEFYAYILDSNNGVVAHLARQLDIGLDEWGERMAAGGLRIADEVDVPDGKLSIRALVLAPDAGRFSMSVTELGHDSAADVAGPGRPRFEDSCENWIPVVTRSAVRPIRSSAIPLWRPGERVTVFAVLGSGRTGETPVVGVLRSAKGDVLRFEAEAEGEAQRETPGDAVSSLTLRVPNAAVGVYDFSIALGEGTESKPAEVWLVPEQDDATVGEPSACAWPEVMQEARRLAQNVEPVPLGGVGGGTLRRRAAQGYLEILRSLGNGQDLGGALDALVSWEPTILGDEIQRNLSVLQAVQVEIAQRLAVADSESLLPLFRLHQSAYQAYFRKRDFGMAGHSRRLAAAIAEIRLVHSPPVGEPGWAADALVSLAATADRHLMYAASQDFLERAVEVDPRHREGRLLLSMLYEKLGEYESAKSELSELVAAAPADAEGWVRLATIEQRLGHAAASRGALLRVIGQRPPPWILSIAYQTLVKQLYAQGDFRAGLGVLAEAELVLPSDRRLGLAKAYGLDRLGRGPETVSALGQLGSEVDDGKSFRLQYAEAGRDLARRVELRLERNAMVRQPRLGIAVTKAFAAR